MVSTSVMHLAVDIGTTRTAAAIARIDDEGSVAVEPFTVGRHTDSAPSAIFVADGDLLFGDAAVRRGIAQPERLIRDFKRRVGDGVPILAGDRRFAPEQLFALMVTWVVDAVAEREGERPSSLALSVPATWGEHRCGLVADALGRAGWRDVRFISEPESAACHYAAVRTLDSASSLVVYDLGGGTFDAALVRTDADGRQELIGEPVGLERLGGSDFDDAVLRHAVSAAGVVIDDLADDEDARADLAALRREAVEAKEALSFDAETVIPLVTADGRSTVRLTRSEFESMIEADIESTVDVVEGLLRSVDLHPDDVGAILLTGGSSRIPRIAQLLSEHFDRPVAVDADPKAVVSLGAARALVEDAAPEAEAAPAAEATHEEAAAAPAFDRPEPRRRWLGRAATIAAVAGGAIVLSAGIALAASSLGAGADDVDPAPSSIPLPSPASPSADPSTAPSSSAEPAEPLLTPAPPGTVTDVFPSPAATAPAPEQTAAP